MSSYAGLDPVVVKLIVHLNEFLQFPESTVPQSKLISSAELKLKIDSSLYENDETAKNVLPVCLSILRSEAIDDNDEIKLDTIKIMDSILYHYSFEQIINLFFNLQVLEEGLNIGNNSLRILITKIIKKSSPSDLIANTIFLHKLIELLNSDEISIGLTNEIEKTVIKLCQDGELIRRRLVSQEILTLLFKLRTNYKLLPRLLDLLAGIIPTFQENLIELPKELYIIPLDEFNKLAQDDVLLITYIISFYTKLVSILNKLNKSQRDLILNNIKSEQLKYITEIYTDDEYLSNDKLFFKFEPVELLIALSYNSIETFKEMNKNNLILSKMIDEYKFREESLVLISNINPILLMNSNDFIIKLRLNSKTIMIYNNLISTRETFSKLIELNNDIKDFKIINFKLDTETFMKLILFLSNFNYSTEFLINNLSNCLNKLIDDFNSNNILNKEIWNLKLKILDNLLFKNSDLINVWEPKLKGEYNLMVKGSEFESKIDVATMTS